MARVIVTGATGFLGGAVVRHLSAKGDHVIALGRSQAVLEEFRGAGINGVALDLSKEFAKPVTELIGRADAMVHCAALSSPWGAQKAFIEANVHGTATAIKLAKAAGVRRFVNISSPTVYYAHRDRVAVTEDQILPPPINDYAETKLKAEELVLATPEMGPITLRPRGVYGAGETTLVPRLLAAARQGPLPLLRQGVAEIDLTHVSDVVRAIDAALQVGPEREGETFNISGGQTCRIVDIVNRVCFATSVKVRWRKMPWRAVIGAAHLSERLHSQFWPELEPRLTRYKVGLFAFRQSLDISKAERLLGWQPAMDFEAGIEQVFSQQAT